jgi:hypothetical protein
MLVLAVALSSEALVIALIAARGTRLLDLAAVLGCGAGVPLALLVAFLLRRKVLWVALGLSIAAIAGGTILCERIFGPNPIPIAGAVVLIGMLLWLVLPDQPDEPDVVRCARCGYSLRGLQSRICPELAPVPWTG